jgi:DNA-binding NarL/FixJ family response regulator
MRVLVADTHSEVRWALRTVIGEEPGLTLAGEVSDYVQLVQQVRTLQPDVIVLEWELPDQPEGDLLAALGSTSHGSRVIVLSQQPEVRQAALAAGADAFVSKAGAPQELLAALRGLVQEPEIDALTAG